MNKLTDWELLQAIKDKVEYIQAQGPDEEEILWTLTEITRMVTILYRRIEEEE